MSSNKKSDTTGNTSPKTATALSTADRQIAHEQKQGFRGTEVDLTPNENYTVQGVTSGAPTPETDAGQAKAVREETGLGLSPLEAAEREKTQRGEK